MPRSRCTFLICAEDILGPANSVFERMDAAMATAEQSKSARRRDNEYLQNQVVASNKDAVISHQKALRAMKRKNSKSSMLQKLLREMVDGDSD